MTDKAPRVWLSIPIVWLSALACADAKGVQIEQAPSPVKGPPLDVAGPQWTRVAPRLLRGPDDEPADDPALRRTYGPANMKLGDCLKREADGAIVGSACASGFAVFGPYVDAPSNSDVRIQFEVHAVDALRFSSDVVSSEKLTHALIEPQTLAAGESRMIGYRVHLTKAVKALEARVWVGAEKPAAFQIKNLAVAVQ